MRSQEEMVKEFSSNLNNCSQSNAQPKVRETEVYYGKQIYVTVVAGYKIDIKSKQKIHLRIKRRTTMNNPTNKRIQKAVVATMLSLSITLSAGLFIQAPTAQAATAKSNPIATSITNTGEKFLGVPYKFSAKAGRTDQFDCSSFTQYVFKKNGIDLPRSSRDQAKVGTPVSKNDLRAGDLVFSDTNRDGKINHVSIYIGNGKLLHTYRVGIGVAISDFEGSTWDKTFVTARRVINNDQPNLANNSNGSNYTNYGGQAE